ncbi:hypothetical protein R1sor_024419 [Riccia sorocarpa]|uniref:DUF4283 domain-containing protein n=1 Tax=Riccia sorocarpa TaxID=122646 RepID=A0ABD3GQL8_9MARC
MGDKGRNTPMSRVMRGFEAAREKMLRGNISQKGLTDSSSKSADTMGQILAHQPAHSSTSSQANLQIAAEVEEGTEKEGFRKDPPLDLDTEEDFPPLTGKAPATTSKGEMGQSSHGAKLAMEGQADRDKGKVPSFNAWASRPRMILQRTRGLRNPYLDGIDPEWGKSITDEKMCKLTEEINRIDPPGNLDEAKTITWSEEDDRLLRIRFDQLRKASVIIQALDSQPTRDEVEQWLDDNWVMRLKLNIVQLRVLNRQIFLLVLGSQEQRDNLLSQTPLWMDGTPLQVAPWTPDYNPKKSGVKRIATWVELPQPGHLAKDCSGQGVARNEPFQTGGRRTGYGTGRPGRPGIIPVGATLPDDDSNEENEDVAGEKHNQGADKISQNRERQEKSGETPAESEQLVAVTVADSQDSPSKGQVDREERVLYLQGDVGEKERLEENLEAHLNELAMIVRSPDRSWADIQEEEMTEHATRWAKGRPMDPHGTPDKGNDSKRQVREGQAPSHQRVDSFSQLVPTRLEWALDGKAKLPEPPDPGGDPLRARHRLYQGSRSPKGQQPPVEPGEQLAGDPPGRVEYATLGNSSKENFSSYKLP